VGQIPRAEEHEHDEAGGGRIAVVVAVATAVPALAQAPKAQDLRRGATP